MGHRWQSPVAIHAVATGATGSTHHSTGAARDMLPDTSRFDEIRPHTVVATEAQLQSEAIMFPSQMVQDNACEEIDNHTPTSLCDQLYAL